MQIAPQGTLGSVGYLDRKAGTNMAAVCCKWDVVLQAAISDMNWFIQVNKRPESPWVYCLCMQCKRRDRRWTHAKSICVAGLCTSTSVLNMLKL